MAARGQAVLRVARMCRVVVDEERSAGHTRCAHRAVEAGPACAAPRAQVPEVQRLAEAGPSEEAVLGQTPLAVNQRSIEMVRAEEPIPESLDKVQPLGG